jgi:hypothetical protein
VVFIKDKNDILKRITRELNKLPNELSLCITYPKNKIDRIGFIKNKIRINIKTMLKSLIFLLIIPYL